MNTPGVFAHGLRHASPCFRKRCARGSEGVTLVEMMVAMMILALVAAGLLYGVMTGVRLNYATAQRAAAFGLCVDLYEQMRGAEYEDVKPANFPAETLKMGHLGGSQRVPLSCQRSCLIVNQVNPNRKEVEITVRWVYMGRTMAETLNGMIFQQQ